MSLLGITASGNTTTPGPANFINFDTAGSGSWTVPAGVTSVVIKLWGGGGGSGGDGYSQGGGGGGGGAYASKTLSVSGGQVLNFTVGSGGTAGGYVGFPVFYQDGTSGSASTYSTVTAGGGGGGTDGGGGAGGSASNGDVNTSGQSGFYVTSPFNDKGGLAGNSPNATANSTTSPFNGIQPGGGQGGGGPALTGTGAVGRVRFEW